MDVLVPPCFHGLRERRRVDGTALELLERIMGLSLLVQLNSSSSATERAAHDVSVFLIVIEQFLLPHKCTPLFYVLYES